jgi:hypothetical protein
MASVGVMPLIENPQRCSSKVPPWWCCRLVHVARCEDVDEVGYRDGLVAVGAEAGEADKAAELRWFDLDALPTPAVPHELFVLGTLADGGPEPVVTFGF